MKSAVLQNEIRDYLARAPRRFHFDGARMVNTTCVRLKWLSDIARGTLDERINRRAGLQSPWIPWQHPVQSAIRRHHRNEQRKLGMRWL